MTSPNALIVDDDRKVQRLLADVLTREGFSVQVERDGEWAVRTFQKKRVDVMLLDYHLPALNGFEVASQIRALPKGSKIPIIMMSGVYKSKAHIQEAIDRYGAFTYLEKPFKVSTLVTALKSALGSNYPETTVSLAKARKTVPQGQAETHIVDLPEEERTAVEEASRAPASGAPAGDSGGLSSKPFAELLAEHNRARDTGTLALRRGDTKKVVYFRKGNPVSVKSNVVSECLGRVLVSAKMISETECEESLRRMKATGRQQGTVLVTMGSISPHNLKYALSLQLKTKLEDLFSWNDGEYQFDSSGQLPKDTVELDVPVATLLYDGIRLGVPDTSLDTLLQPHEAKFPRHAENPLFAFQDMPLTDEEHALLSTMDGRRTVADLIRSASLPRSEAQRLFYALLCSQMVELSDAPTPKLVPLVQSSWEVEEISGSELRDLDPPPLRPRTPPPKAAAPPPQPREKNPSLLPDISYVNIPNPFAANAPGRERENLMATLADASKKDFFSLLGVQRDVDTEALKRAYFPLAKKYHPDKYRRSESKETRDVAQKLYQLYTAAYDTLMSAPDRETYLRRLDGNGLAPKINSDVAGLLAAEQNFLRGEELLKQNRFSEAHTYFEEAVKLSPDEAEFRAYLAWTHFQKTPTLETADQALRWLDEAISLNPTQDRAYLFSGYIYKAVGRPDKAEKQFEKALQSNPDCHEALLELSVMPDNRVG